MSKIKVRVHKGVFTNKSSNPDYITSKIPVSEEYYFINILNKRCKESVIIIGVVGWKPIVKGRFSEKLFVNIEPVERPLPDTIQPRSEWETWIKVSELGFDAYDRIIVTTGDGNHIVSKKRIRVPQLCTYTDIGKVGK